MMIPQQRALIPGDPGAFKRRRLSNLSDGNRSAVAALLSFKGSTAMASPSHVCSDQPPLLAVNANDQLRGDGGGHSFSSTSTICSSVTYNASCTSEQDQDDRDNAAITSNFPTVRASRLSTSPPHPHPSLLTVAMTQLPNLPHVGTVRDVLSEWSFSLPAGRPLSPPPRLPPPQHLKHRHYNTK